MVLYLATNEAVAPVEAAGISLTEGHAPRSIRQLFPGKALHEIRTKEGCACGFINDEDPPDPDVLATREKLQRILDLAMQTSTGGQLLATWIGDERKEPLQRTIHLSALPEETFASTWDRPLLLHLEERSH